MPTPSSPRKLGPAHIRAPLPMLLLRYALRMVLSFKLLTGCRALCRCVFRVLAWLPVVFVTIVVLWGYYVYVYIMNISG